MEIYSDGLKNGSVGDYNPQGIRLFYEYLMARHGSLTAINKYYGTKFTKSFFDWSVCKGIFEKIVVEDFL